MGEDKVPPHRAGTPRTHGGGKKEVLHNLSNRAETGMAQFIYITPNRATSHKPIHSPSLQNTVPMALYMLTEQLNLS